MTATPSGTRSSRKRPTASCCPASGLASMRRSPRRSSGGPARHRPSSPTNGTRRGASRRRSRRRSRPASPLSGPPPSPRPSSTSAWPSTCGTRSRMRLSGRRCRGSTCRCAPPTPRCCLATSIAASRSSARRSPPSIPSRSRCAPGSSTSGSAATCGSPTAPGTWRRTSRPCGSCPSEPPTPERASVLAGLGQALMLSGRVIEAVEVCSEAVAVRGGHRVAPCRRPRPQLDGGRAGRPRAGPLRAWRTSTGPW